MSKTRRKPKASSTLRKGQQVSIASGQFAGRIGTIRSIDHANHPDAPYFVMSDKDADEDVYIMGRFPELQLAREP